MIRVWCVRQFTFLTQFDKACRCQKVIEYFSFPFFFDGQDVSYFSIVSMVSIVNDVDIVIVFSIVSIVRNVSSVQYCKCAVM